MLMCIFLQIFKEIVEADSEPPWIIDKWLGTIIIVSADKCEKSIDPSKHMC